MPTFDYKPTPEEIAATYEQGLEQIIQLVNGLCARCEALENLLVHHDVATDAIAPNTENEVSSSPIDKDHQFLDGVLDSISDAIVACDEFGALTLFNRATLEISGLPAIPIPPEEWANYYDLYHSDGETVMQLEEVPLYRALTEGQVTNQEMVLVPKNLPKRWLLASGRAIYSSEGKKIGAVVSMHDVTERKLAENALVLHLNNLEDTVAARTDELKIAHDKALEANKAKTRFLSNMSHEIRTPLNGIVGFVELLAMTNLKTQQREYIQIINHSVTSLLNIVNDILDITKIESGHFSIRQRSFCLRETVEELEKLLTLKASKKNIGLQIAFDNKISKNLLGDATKVRQVLLNLLDNAIKFTAQGKVKLTIKRDKLESNIATIDFQVSDTGIGISENDQDSIFGAFTQLDVSEEINCQGTGLGLAISKQLVEALGGELKLESTPNQGSKFYFTLAFPIDENSTHLATVQKPNNTDDELRDTRVLIVDDDATNRKFLSYLLDDLNIISEEAKDGLEAVQMATNQSFDFIFMDIRMPRMDGIEATKNIRAHETPEQHIPIVALTAHALDEERKVILASGIDECLIKPILPNILIETLNRWVKQDSNQSL